MKKLTLGTMCVALGLAVACGNSGSGGAPNANQLLSKFNQYIKCITSSYVAKNPTQAEIDQFNSACTDNDRVLLNGWLDCVVALSCDKSTSQCSAISLTTSCDALLNPKKTGNYDFGNAFKN